MRSILAPNRVIRMRVGISVPSKHIKNKRIFSDENVSTKKSIMMDISNRNIFCTFFL